MTALRMRTLMMASHSCAVHSIYIAESAPFMQSGSTKLSALTEHEESDWSARDERSHNLDRVHSHAAIIRSSCIAVRAAAGSSPMVMVMVGRGGGQFVE